MEVTNEGTMIKLRTDSVAHNVYGFGSYGEEVLTAFEVDKLIDKLREASKKARYAQKGIKV